MTASSILHEASTDCRVLNCPVPRQHLRSARPPLSLSFGRYSTFSSSHRMKTSTCLEIGKARRESRGRVPKAACSFDSPAASFSNQSRPPKTIFANPLAALPLVSKVSSSSTLQPVTDQHQIAVRIFADCSSPIDSWHNRCPSAVAICDRFATRCQFSSHTWRPSWTPTWLPVLRRPAVQLHRHPHRPRQSPNTHPPPRPMASRMRPTQIRPSCLSATRNPSSRLS